MSGRRARRQPGGAKPGGHKVGPGTVVAFAYVLSDAEGEPVEISEPGDPLVVLIGYGSASPALERALEGLGEGDTREVTLPPEEAFGPREADAIIEVDRADLPADIAPGDEFEAERADGQGLVPLKVLELSDDIAVLDTNHPLAGQRVRLRVIVEGVRPASAEEMALATERVLAPDAAPPGPLLPAERLLKRYRGEPVPETEEPKPPPGRIA